MDSGILNEREPRPEIGAWPPLKVCAIQLRFAVNGHVRGWRGSAWRGAFGHALKRLVCMFPKGVCDGCPLRASCAFIQIAGEPDSPAPAPYALFPADNDTLDVALIGARAAAQTPFVIHALRQAGMRGVRGARFELREVAFWQGEWRETEGSPAPVHIPPSPSGAALHIRMQSPLRFKHKERFVRPEQMNLSLWLLALRRRLRELAAHFGDAAAMEEWLDAFPREGAWRDAAWRWREVSRWSRRQGCAMKVGGVTGAFTLDAATARALWPMLWLGEWTHAGRLATMGLGKYELEVIGG